MIDEKSQVIAEITKMLSDPNIKLEDVGVENETDEVCFDSMRKRFTTGVQTITLVIYDPKMNNRP